MLNKELLLKLNREQKYSEMWEVFVNEYVDMLSDFFIRKRAINEKRYGIVELLDLLEHYENDKYNEAYNIIIEILYNEDKTYSEVINDSVDNYKKIKNILES